MACQPCWVSPDPCPDSCVDQPSLFPLTLPSCSSGDLGGQMGLFIGASILTLLEILDYIYEVRIQRKGQVSGCGSWVGWSDWGVGSEF